MKAVLFDIENIVPSSNPPETAFVNDEIKPELERLVLEGVTLYAVSEMTTESWNSYSVGIPQLLIFFNAVLALGDSTDGDQIRRAYRTFLDRNNLEASNCLYFYNRASELEKHGITTSLGMETEIHTKWLHVRLVLHGIYWPEARSSTCGLTKEEADLAGELLKHIAVKMCSLYDQLNWDAEPFPFRKEMSTAGEWEHCFDTGTLFSHGHMTAFEHSAYCLQICKIAQEVGSDCFELLMAPADISGFLAKHSDLTKEKFALSVESFFELEDQCGWEKNYFDAGLLSKFIAAGLVGGGQGPLMYTAAMDPYFTMCSGGWPGRSADEFFRSICA